MTPAVWRGSEVTIGLAFFLAQQYFFYAVRQIEIKNKIKKIKLRAVVGGVVFGKKNFLK